VVLPDDAGYDNLRAVWNGAVDRHPAAIVRAGSVEDVVTVVGYARETGQELAVRCGGHSLPGFSTTDGGIVLDLSEMNGVEVDTEGRIARVQGGATWADYDAATHAHGLATTGGLISTTGVGGLTLGGGIGWLVRRCGLSCDNLVGAEVVLADGSVVRADSGANPDLLGGLRGGGGNFGVVTSFEFRLYPVRDVLAGILMFPEERASEVLRHYRSWARDLPDELSTLAAFTTAPPMPFVPEELHMKRVIGIIGCHAGDAAEGEALLQPLLALDPPIQMVAPMPYPALQSMLDESAPAGLQNHFKGGYLDHLSDAAIDVLVSQAGRRTSDLSELHLHHMGGAVARVGEDDTAVSNRGAEFAYNVIAMWEDRAQVEIHRGWARETSARLEPVSSDGTYVNFLTDATDTAVHEAYGSKYQRLADLKRRYDPTNLFHLNQNIRP
jgi:FAD/FMN-containing dehydrogenase